VTSLQPIYVQSRVRPSVYPSQFSVLPKTAKHRITQTMPTISSLMPKIRMGSPPTGALNAGAMDHN